jgi:hypothetical protein
MEPCENAMPTGSLPKLAENGQSQESGTGRIQ